MTSELVQPENAPSSNPFVSPSETDQRPVTTVNVPSITTLAICGCVALVAALATSYAVYSDEGSSVTRKLVCGLGDVIFAVVSGMGLALVVHALRYRRWDSLAPGHWRLITSLFLYTIYVAPSVPELCSALFFGVMLWRTSESKLWKAFAWSSIVGYMVAACLVIVTTMVVGDPNEIMTALTEDGLSISNSPLLPVMLGVGILQNLVDTLTFGLLIAAVLTDLQRGVLRDAYHYIGVVVMVILPLVLWMFQFLVSQIS